MTQPETNWQLFEPSPYCKSYINPDKDAVTYKEENPLKKIIIGNPGKILQLCENLTDSHTKYLEAKANIYFKVETGARTVFFINLFHISNKASIQVVQTKILETPITYSLCEDTISNILVYKNNVLRCTEKLDAKIQRMIEEVTKDEVTKEEGESAIIIVPVISKEKRTNVPNRMIYCPVYLICFVEPSKEAFIVKTLVEETMNYCLTLLINTRLFEEEKELKIKCQNLLSIARKLFSELENLQELLKLLMKEIRTITDSERCTLLLLDPNHVDIIGKVFDSFHHDKKTMIKIAKDQGIAGYVAATGKTLNIKHPYKHPLFYKERDEATGCKTRNILCFPIRDENGIVGVVQLFNKIDGNFNYFDEQIANAFSIYCGLSIMHSLVYKKTEDAQIKCQLSNRRLLHHFEVKDRDIAEVLLCKGYHQVSDLENFSFGVSRVIHHEIPCYILKMFHNLKLCEDFNIKDDVFVRFLLYVQRGYKDLLYHGWNHAFSSTHFAYVVLKRFHLVERGYLSKLESLAYMISCVCHDIEHKVTTNSCEPHTNSLLASVYSSNGSIMEKYQLSQTLCILNLEGCNFLENLNITDFSKCIDLIKSMIIATDLEMHYRIHSRQFAMACEGFNGNNPEHRFLFCSLLMTCADLAEYTKEWIETKRVAQLLYAEFFKEGDFANKVVTGSNDIEDPDKVSMPDVMFDFLTDCCICIFRILSKLFPLAECLVDVILKNITCWDLAKGVFQDLCLEGGTTYDILMSEEFENGVQKALFDFNQQEVESNAE